MPNYTYTTTQKKGPPAYTLVTLDPTPAGYQDIHLTIPSDPPVPSKSGKIADEDIWKQKHVTFVFNDGRKLHCFIKTIKNKYTPFDGTGAARNLEAGEKLIWQRMFEDQVVIDAVF
ncbi:MAG: hypothetical protein QM776_07015 [Rhodocyclaceae bacterium]